MRALAHVDRSTLVCCDDSNRLVTDSNCQLTRNCVVGCETNIGEGIGTCYYHYHHIMITTQYSCRISLLHCFHESAYSATA